MFPFPAWLVPAPPGGLEGGSPPGKAIGRAPWGVWGAGAPQEGQYPHILLTFMLVARFYWRPLIRLFGFRLREMGLISAGRRCLDTLGKGYFCGILFGSKGRISWKSGISQISQSSFLLKSQETPQTKSNYFLGFREIPDVRDFFGNPELFGNS